VKRESAPLGNLGVKCITGTDTGSVLIQNLLRVVVAAAILIGVVRGIGGNGGARAAL